MHRKETLDLLQRYNPIFQEELGYKKRILEFIHNHTDCFERSLEEGHITASAWLLDDTEEKALLLHHAKIGIWCQPGGHCDGNPNVLAMSIQEAQEETGILDIRPLQMGIFDLDIHTICAHKGIKEHLHYDIRFLLKVNSKQKPSINSESKGYMWIEKDSSSYPTQERSILRMIEKWKAYLQNKP